MFQECIFLCGILSNSLRAWLIRPNFVKASKRSVSRMTFGRRDWVRVWAWHCETVEWVLQVRSSDDKSLRGIVIDCVVNLV